MTIIAANWAGDLGANQKAHKMRLACLAFLAPFALVDVAVAGCDTATAAFEEIAPVATAAVESVRTTVGVLDKFSGRSPAELAAYGRVNIALDAYLPTLARWMETVGPANDNTSLCRQGKVLTVWEIYAIEAATLAGREMINATASYLTALEAVPAQK